MIDIPEFTPAHIDHTIPSFFGLLSYSFSNNSFVFPSTTAKHNFYPPCTGPPSQRHIIRFTEASDETFVVGKNGRVFRVIGKMGYKFKMDSPIQRVRVMGNQVFYSAQNKLYSTCEDDMQSLEIRSNDIDVTCLTKEVVILQDDCIRILNGPKFALNCRDPQKILFGDHPRTVYLFTSQGVFFVDLRSKKVELVLGTTNNIVDAVKSKEKVVVRTYTGINIIDKKIDNQLKSSIALKDSMKMTCNDNYIIAWKDNNFEFYNINNLNDNEAHQYDLHDLVSFATFKDKYYFFRRKKIEEFNIEGSKRSTYCPVEETWFRHVNVDFFESELVENERCKDYFEIDDIKSAKYDDIMESIGKFGMEEKAPAEETVQKTRVKRTGGF